MIDKELLELLVCPENQAALHLADQELIDRINEAIERRQLTNRGGQTVEERVSSGLVRDDGLLFYPVIDDIPVMIIDEAIPLEKLGD
jgi:uncharacterized protein YbaR (Trm112 family)